MTRIAPTQAKTHAPTKVIISFYFEEIPLGATCSDALEAQGYEVHRFNAFQPRRKFVGRKTLERLFVLLCRLALIPKSRSKQWLPWDEERVRMQRLLRAVEDIRPDVLLVISTFTYPRQVLEKIRALGVKHVIGWCVEGPTWIRSPLQEAKLYDRYFCIHRHGIPADSGIQWLPAIAYDAGNYHRIEPRPEKRHDIVFVGRPKPRRAEFLKAILDLKPLIFGPGWDVYGEEMAAAVGDTLIAGERLNRLYNETKIVLNISSWENAGQDCPNLRIADIPATGSFLLSDYSDYAAEIFVPGKEMEFFSSTEELRDKTKFYLAHEAARERIARAGHEKAKKLEDFDAKMRRIFDGIPPSVQQR